MTEIDIQKEKIRKRNNDVRHPKAFEVPTKKNTGMDENIPVCGKTELKQSYIPII